MITPSYLLLIVISGSYYVSNLLSISYENSFYLLIPFVSILSLSIVFQKSNRTVSQTALYGSLLFLFVFYYSFTTQYVPPNSISKLEQSIVGVKGYVADNPLIRQDSLGREYQRIIVECETAFLHNEKSLDTNGKILVKHVYPDVNIQIGDTVLVKGNFISAKNLTFLNGFNYGEYLLRKNIYYTVKTRYFDDLIKLKSENQNLLYYITSEVRKLIHNVFEDNLPEEYSKLVLRMLFHGREELEPGLIDEFRMTGIVHILVVSGQNVVILSVMFLGIFSIFGLPKILSFISVIFVNLFYMIVVGFDPPVVRASIMVSLTITAFLLRRDINVLNILCLTGIIILLISPNALFELSFQLSFLATLGIMLFYRRFELIFNNIRLPKMISMPLSVTLSSQILIAPLLIHAFHGYSIVSLLSNIVIEVIVAVLMPLAILTMLLYFVIPFLSQFYFESLKFVIWLLLKTNNFFSEVPFAYIKIEFLEEEYVILYYLLLTTLFAIQYAKIDKKNAA